MNLEQHIAAMLEANPTSRRPLTIGDLARHFGVSSSVVRMAAQRVVDQGLAAPTKTTINAVSVLHGLLPPAAAAAAAAAPVEPLQLNDPL